MLTKGHLAKSCAITPGAVWQTIKRLCDKGFVKRLETRSGVSGFVVLYMPQNVYEKIRTDGIEYAKFENNSDDIPQTNQISNQPSNYISNQPSNHQLPPLEREKGIITNSLSEEPFKYHEVILDKLAPKISSNSLRKVRAIANLTVDDVQDFIDRFYSMANTTKTTLGEGLFVSRLKEYATTGVNPLADIKTEEELEFEQALLLAKQKQLELTELKRKELDQRIENEFSSSLQSISNEDKENYFGNNKIIRSLGESQQKMFLKDVFTREVFGI